VASEGTRGAAAQLSERQFGGRIVELETNPVVGTDAAEYLGADPERVLLLIVNLSSSLVMIGFRNDVSLNNGIRLGANGGSLRLDALEDGTLVTRQIWAVADAAASQTYALRLRRDSSVEQTDPFDGIV